MYGAFFTHLATQSPVVLLPAFAEVHLLHTCLSQVFHRPCGQQRSHRKPRKVWIVARVLTVKRASEELPDQEGARFVLKIKNIDAKPSLFGKEAEIRLSLRR